jgi:hypothetical protein
MGEAGRKKEVRIKFVVSICIYKRFISEIISLLFPQVACGSHGHWHVCQMQVTVDDICR